MKSSSIEKLIDMTRNKNNFDVARKCFLEGLEFFEKEMFVQAEGSFRESLKIKYRRDMRRVNDSFAEY